MRLKYLSAILAILIVLQTKAQISKSQYQQIDSLFVAWNQPNHPGGAVAVMYDDQMLFSKAYGLASLEYLVPNSTGTIFNTGSVSKQFTAMGIVRLHVQGKLSVDDDIRKHLPELPDFGEKITIRHMLHHTSGLRSLHAMLELAGWGDDDSRTNADLDRFILKQKDLNFKPGDQYLYCNTGYMLMANIIERVTGEKFPQWMKQNIFEPLGMINTYVEDKYNRVVPGNATSYYRNREEGFTRAVEYWGYVGSGNMHSTTDDLLKWLQNFYAPTKGWEEAFKLMQTVDNFNNGKPNNYAFGVNVNQVDGRTQVDHGGAIGGFRAFSRVYTNEKISIVVLTNFSAGGPGGKANQIADILFKKSGQSSMQTKEPIKTISLSANQLKKFEGHYWNDQDNYSRKIYLKNDTLRYFRAENNENPLVPIAKNEFMMWGVDADLKVKFVSSENNQKLMQVTIENDAPIISSLYEPTNPTEEELKSYCGTFYSPELETTYRIFMEDKILKWHHPRRGAFEMKVLKKDVLEGEWPFNIVKFSRNEQGVVKGAYVSNGRVVNLWFEKK